MKKHCRIVVTDKCNLHCDYCVMKDKAISMSFKKACLLDILRKGYDIFLLTGGEPTVDIPRLQRILTLINYHPGKETYLYTNGLASVRDYESLVKCGLTGLNIGWHGMEMFGQYDKLQQLGISMRIYALYYEVTDQLEIYCRARGIPLHVLSWKQCDNPDEDRYRLY